MEATDTLRLLDSVESLTQDLDFVAHEMRRAEQAANEGAIREIVDALSDLEDLAGCLQRAACRLRDRLKEYPDNTNENQERGQ